MVIAKKILFPVILLILLLTILIPLPEILLKVWFVADVLLSVWIFIVSCFPKKSIYNDFIYTFFTVSFLFTVAAARKIIEMLNAGIKENLLLKISESSCSNNPIFECLIILLLCFCVIFFCAKMKRRNSEISARYILESMPAKLYETENALSKNEITLEEAENRKTEIKSEANYYSNKAHISKCFIMNYIALFVVIFLVFVSVFFISRYLGISNSESLKYACNYSYPLSIIVVVMQIAALATLCKLS